jgi:hypothetical protein
MRKNFTLTRSREALLEMAEMFGHIAADAAKTNDHLNARAFGARAASRYFEACDQCTVCGDPFIPEDGSPYCSPCIHGTADAV